MIALKFSCTWKVFRLFPLERNVELDDDLRVHSQIDHGLQELVVRAVCALQENVDNFVALLSCRRQRLNLFLVVDRQNILAFQMRYVGSKIFRGKVSSILCKDLWTS